MAKKKPLTTYQQGTFGVAHTIILGVPMTEVTAIKLRLRNPNYRLKEVDLPLIAITNKSTGTVVYVFEPGDLDVPGKYKIQVVDISAGKHQPYGVQEFAVVANA
jgi:hypothetical protein